MLIHASLMFKRLSPLRKEAKAFSGILKQYLAYFCNNK